MLRLLQHNPETTAVPRQKTRRAATPETSREEESNKKNHDSEGWKMAPAGRIAFKHTHAGTEKSLCGFEAGL